MIIYDAGRLTHASSTEVRAYITKLDAFNASVAQDDRVEISDRMAQTIASWWQSAYGESATLATRGQVTDTMVLLCDFVSPDDYRTAQPIDRLCLDYLGTYITTKQHGARHLDTL